MVAGSDDVVNLFLDAVRLFAIEPDLMTPLIKPPIALDHREVARGRFVVERDGILSVTDCIGDCGTTE